MNENKGTDHGLHAALLDARRSLLKDLPPEEQAKFRGRQVLYWLGVVLVVPASLLVVLLTVLLVKDVWHAGIFFAAPLSFLVSIAAMLRVLSKHRARLSSDLAKRHAEFFSPAIVEIQPEVKSGTPVSF